MIDLFLVYGIGWKWWAGLGLIPLTIAVILLVQVVGLTRALQIGVALGVALFAAVTLRRARQQGWQEREDKLTRDTAEAVAKYQEKRDEVADLSDADLDRRARRWVRDDEAR